MALGLKRITCIVVRLLSHSIQQQVAHNKYKKWLWLNLIEIYQRFFAFVVGNSPKNILKVFQESSGMGFQHSYIIM